jgi:Tfp pilus assembly protein PilE
MRRCRLRSSARRFAARGFTLAETVVALAILVGAISILITFATDSIRRSNDSQLRSKTALRAAETMEEIVLNPARFLSSGPLQQPIHDNFARAVKVEDIKDSPGLKKFTVTVSYQPLGQSPRFAETLETYLAVPAKE